jgi:RNA polymerase sigma-70 factor (ECF subfamily)
VALSSVDRELLDRCLTGKPRAWEDFVDRFLGLVIHVINHSAQSRGQKLTSQDIEDLAADVFLAIVVNDFAVLRRFRRESSLATYLTVVARRVVVRELLKRKPGTELHDGEQTESAYPSAEQRVMDRDEIERLLDGLEGTEAEVVRLYHLEGKSYAEISQLTHVPENSVGPTLSRARAKIRANANSAASSS